MRDMSGEVDDSVEEGWGEVGEDANTVLGNGSSEQLRSTADLTATTNCDITGSDDDGEDQVDT